MKFILLNNNLFILFIFVPVLTLIIFGLNWLLAIRKPYDSKLSSYECGFIVLPNQTRNPFLVHFWVVAMLFLAFDLEIMYLMPYAVSMHQVSIFGISVFGIFMVVLTAGFALEIGNDAIALTNFQSTPTFSNHKKKSFPLLHTLRTPYA
jgi:NADH:ubiquinone oxidoreductase subunit 3 (subunit A)